MLPLHTRLFVFLLLACSTCFSAELSDSEKRRLSVDFYGDGASNEVKGLAKIEAEIASLPQQQAAVASLIAAAELNAKLSGLASANLNDGEAYTQEQFAYIAMHALSRLSILAQVAKENKAGVCYLAESEVMLELSRGKQVTPANCRHLSYSPDIQALRVRILHTPQGEHLAQLAHTWAKHAGMYAYNMANLEQFGVKAQPLKSPQKQKTEEVCGKEKYWMKAQPVVGQEITLLYASSQLFKKFAEMNSKPDISSENQLWSYKILAIGNALLEKEAESSPQVKSILKSMTDHTVQIINGKVDFREYKDAMVLNIRKAERIEKVNQSTAPSFNMMYASQIKEFSKCIYVTAMYAATRK